MFEPMCPRAEAGATEARLQGRGSSAEQALRVLVAEDDDGFRDLLRDALVREGYDVVAVSSGIELLERLAGSLSSHGEAFGVVISDVRMPGWSGLDVLASLVSEPMAPPVVLITAFGDERLHEQALSAGAAAILDKPFDLETLCDLVDRVVASESKQLSRP
jgi:CheY-like chemotaxis protein